MDGSQFHSVHAKSGSIRFGSTAPIAILVHPPTCRTIARRAVDQPVLDRIRNPKIPTKRPIERQIAFGAPFRAALRFARARDTSFRLPAHPTMCKNCYGRAGGDASQLQLELFSARHCASHVCDALCFDCKLRSGLLQYAEVVQVWPVG